MNTDDLISTFKDILVTPHDQISVDSQQSFQGILRQAPSMVLFKLRSLLDVMKTQAIPKNYSMYSALITSLLDTQDMLPGRISPDILEPITEISVINPNRFVNPYEPIEISTGTSI